MTTWNTITNISGGGAGSAGNSQAAANTFIPKLWSDEVLISREKNLVAASFFKRINHKGKKGDTIIIPLISNLTANDMSQVGAPIAPQVAAEGMKTISLDKWKEVSKGYNDLLMAQSRYDIRGEYTKKAGYALAERLDTDIFALFPANLSAAYKVIGSDGITQWDPAANGNTGNGALQEVAKATGAGDTIFCIGVDTDQWDTVPAAQKCLITSATKELTKSVTDTIAIAKKGDFEGLTTMGSAGLAPFHDFDSKIPADVKTKVEKVVSDLKSGALTTGVTV